MNHLLIFAKLSYSFLEKKSYILGSSYLSRSLASLSPDPFLFLLSCAYQEPLLTSLLPYLYFTKLPKKKNPTQKLIDYKFKNQYIFPAITLVNEIDMLYSMLHASDQIIYS